MTAPSVCAICKRAAPCADNGRCADCAEVIRKLVEVLNTKPALEDLLDKSLFPGLSGKRRNR